jgi:hypothetical protein
MQAIVFRIEIEPAEPISSFQQKLDASSCIADISKIISIGYGKYGIVFDRVKDMLSSSWSDSSEFSALSAKDPRPLCRLYVDPVEPLRTKRRFPRTNELLLSLLQFADLRATTKNCVCVFPVGADLNEPVTSLSEPAPHPDPLEAVRERPSEEGEFAQFSAYQAHRDRLKQRPRDVLATREAKAAQVERCNRRIVTESSEKGERDRLTRGDECVKKEKDATELELMTLSVGRMVERMEEQCTRRRAQRREGS